MEDEFPALGIQQALEYNLKAFNPNAPDNSDRRTPAELIAIIRQAQHEIDEALRALMRDKER